MSLADALALDEGSYIALLTKLISESQHVQVGDCVLSALR